MFQPGFLGGGDARVVFNGFATQTLNTTFAIPLGAATPDRIVSLLLLYVTTAGNDVTAVTIGGIAATRVVKAQQTPGSTWIAEQWVAAVPTGTSANAVVTGGGAAGVSSAYASYSLYDVLSATPAATATDVTSPFTQNLSIPAGGVAIGGYIQTNAGAATWTGLNEDADNSSGTFERSTASLASPAAVNPAITVAATNFSIGAMALAAWR